MKNRFKSKMNWGLIAAMVLLASSCSEFFDINESPNSPDKVPPSIMMSTSLAASAFANSNELNRFASTIMSVTAGAGGEPAAYDRYNISSANFTNQWRFEIYNGALINYELLIEDANERGSSAYAGISKIMKAYTFALATDVWGDIPYSEALKAGDNTHPRLDNQRDIYLGTENIQSLFSMIKEGLEDLEKGEGLVPGQDDLYYRGNISQWKKAGESLLLKLANTISYVEPDQAKIIINEVLERDNFIKENRDNLSMEFGRSAGSRSPIYEWTNVTLFKDNLIISSRFVDLLQRKNDPRLPIFVTRPNGNYVTIDNGLIGPRPQPVSSWSRFSSYVTGESGEGPSRLLTAAQVYFILAEAVIQLGIEGEAESYFQIGIRRSMEEAGVSGEEITSYFAEYPEEVSLNGNTEENLEKILTQKYIALYGNGLEQWNDYRRTGYPRLEQHQNAVGVDGTRPVRAVYVDDELARNPNFSIIQPNVRVWWDID
jgi:hypothetical protein